MVDMIAKKEGLKKEIFKKVNAYYKFFHKRQPFIAGKTRVPYSGRVYNAQEMINLVDSALDFWLTSGYHSNQLEKEMKEYFETQSFLLVNSGSSANLLMVSTLKSEQLRDCLKLGYEVITPAVTFPTTLAPILQNGLIPVFVDCEVGTYNIKAHLIEDAISKKTRAIFIPHTIGNPCDMDTIMSVVEKYNLFILEDVCDAFGATFDGRMVGTFGDMASLSFYPAHHITMGEGGGVIVNNRGMEKIARSIRDWGRDCWCEPGRSNTCGNRFKWQIGDLPYGYDHKYTYSNIGYNLKITEMQAAIGLAQLGKVDHFIEKRRENFKKYYDGLKKYEEFLILPRVDSRANPSWFGFPITVKNGISRLELIQWLEEANIETRLVFGGNIIRQPGFKNAPHRIYGVLEESDRIMKDTFFIGVYPGLTGEMVEFVISMFGEFFKTKRLL